MKRLLHTPIALTAWRILLLYVVLMCCRVLFYLYNRGLIDPVEAESWGTLLRGALQFDTASLVYADALLLLLALAPWPTAWRAKRWYRDLCFYYYVVVNALMVVATNLADIVYFHYTQKRLTADEMLFASNDNSLWLIGKFMAENWYLVLVGAALIVLLARGYGRRIEERAALTGWRHYLAQSVVLVVTVLMAVGGLRGGFTRMTRPITLSNAALYVANGQQANLILSNPFCILRTAGGMRLRVPHYLPEAEVADYFTPYHYPTADSTAVDLSGRNVMIFILESMSAEHSAELHPEIYANLPEKGFTPFLDSLMRSGLTFRRLYANGTRSIQAMPAVLGSIPSLRDPFVLMPEALGESRQLPAILADKGYQTLFFCGSERGSMGFGAYARQAGIERLVSREDYEAAHGKGDFDNYWGIWDEEFLQFAGEELSRTPEPFMGTLFTLSSHHPFVVPARYETTLPKGYTKIHRGVAYDDEAMRRFFARYGDEPWFRRTLFLFVADHVSSEKFAEATRRYPGDMHIVGFIYSPDGALQGQIEEVTQQIDLMPTLLGLMGHREPYFAYGRDVLHESERPAWSVSYDGRFRAWTDTGAIYLADDGDALPEEATPIHRQLGAFVQQYYTHAKAQYYVVPNR